MHYIIKSVQLPCMDFLVCFLNPVFSCAPAQKVPKHTHTTHTHASIDLRITVRWILLGLLATARGVQFLTEQPGSSLMPMLCYFQFVAMIIRPVTWNSVKLLDAQWMGIEPSPWIILCNCYQSYWKTYFHRNRNPHLTAVFMGQ